MPSRPHLLRHVFATHTVQVEKIPLDVMGEMLYEAHGTWRGIRHRRSTPRSGKPEPIRVKPDRDLGRAGQRYMRLSKGDLVARLLVAEQAGCEYERKWLQTSDELFAWMLVVGALFRTA